MLRLSDIRKKLSGRRALLEVLLVLCGLAVIAAAIVAAYLRPRTELLAPPKPAAPVTETAQHPRQPVKPAPRPTRPVEFSEGCSTAECHAPATGALVVHAPFARSECQACHQPDQGDHKFPLRDTKEAICTSCHDTSSHGTFQHKAMTGDSCLACHDPHTSKAKGLLLGASTRETCVRCHPGSEGAVVHKPYGAGSCDACHDPHGADNRGLLLGGAGPDNCRMCHSQLVNGVETSKHSHGTAKGQCMACHSPHASEHKGLLTARTKDLCVTCHNDVGTTVGQATLGHAPVMQGDECVTCHEPHASSHPRMLRDTQPVICLSCHDKPVKAADGHTVIALGEELSKATVVHGAVKAGDCSACHSVHGATHERLLRQINTDVFAGPFDVKNYALCFACHDPSLAEVAGATSFRDGDKNLHQSHLRAGDQSRGCAACHAIHSGETPRLIAKTVNYQGSSWAMPMGFVITPTGGSCSPGCHEVLAYDRRPGGYKANKNGGAP